jgi:hypothetical protein
MHISTGSKHIPKLRGTPYQKQKPLIVQSLQSSK